MQFNPRTLSVLKNFSLINPSIMFRSGDVLRTMSPTKTIIAKAKVDNEFPTTFGIYDVSRFINTMSLFDNPDLDITDKRIRISNGKTDILYTCGDPKLIIVPPEKDLKLPSVEVQFTLTNDMLQHLFKAMNILGLPEVAVIGDGEKLSLKAIDYEGKTHDTYSLEIGETDKQFRIIFKVENLKLLPMDYSVSIARKNNIALSYFKGQEFDLDYFIAVESTSQIGE